MPSFSEWTADRSGSPATPSLSKVIPTVYLNPDIVEQARAPGSDLSGPRLSRTRPAAVVGPWGHDLTTTTAASRLRLAAECNDELCPLTLGFDAPGPKCSEETEGGL